MDRLSQEELEMLHTLYERQMYEAALPANVALRTRQIRVLIAEVISRRQAAGEWKGAADGAHK